MNSPREHPQIKPAEASTDMPGTVRAQRGLFDRQRNLIEQLTTLWAHHAKCVEEITHTHEQASQACTQKYDQQEAIAEKELSRRTQKAQTELTSAIAQYDAQLENALALHQKTWETKLEVEQEEYDLACEQANNEAREAIWLAETVYESSRPRPDKTYRAVIKKIEAGTKSIAHCVELSALLWPAVAKPDPKLGEAAATNPNTSDALDAPDASDTTDALTHEALLKSSIAALKAQLLTLDRMSLPRFFRSGLLWVLAPSLVLGAVLAAGFFTHWTRWIEPTAAGVAGLIIVTVLSLQLGRKARQNFRQSMHEFSHTLAQASSAAEQARAAAIAARDNEIAAITSQRDTDIQLANETLTAAMQALEALHQTTRSTLLDHQNKEHSELERVDTLLRKETNDKVQAYLAHATAQHDETIHTATSQRDEQQAIDHHAFDQARHTRMHDWNTQSAALKSELDDQLACAARLCPPWQARLDGSWTPTLDQTFGVLIGRLRIPLDSLIASAPTTPSDTTPTHTTTCPEGKTDKPASGAATGISPRAIYPDPMELPILLEPASRGSLLIETSPAHREEAINLLGRVLLRVLTTAPPGRARLTIFDPVGRGRSFAGLMRLSDHDESLVGARIWTESRHMEQRLTDITEHIENVIQKYLRDDYESIDDYNRIAGEIAEPYRYLVIADFPTNFSEDAANRLASIIDSGSRCGVHVIMMVDPAGKIPKGFDLDALRKRAIVLASTSAGFCVQEDPFRRIPMMLDDAPDESQAVELLDQIGMQAIEASRVEVRYSMLMPEPDRYWSRSCEHELKIPLGRTGATRIQELVLGRGTSQHVLIAGKTGSGKSTLLHVLATSAMLWFSPAELELYLVDFKKGVEFKAYATPGLPHIRAVAIESDREFGLSVLEKLDAELRRRGDLFREHSVQSLAQYREQHPDTPMPRTLLIIDEFQEFFVEDDRVAQDANLLLDRLVRQGRAFGIHVLLASQTLSGAYALGRSTMGQMAVRIALKCSETDSYLILSEDNGAARLLGRPGEAIYNDANGLLEGNHPFQVAWLSDQERSQALEQVVAHGRTQHLAISEPVLFEGNAPAHIERNPLLKKAVADHARPIAPQAWLGAPVSIKDPTAAVLRRRSGANLLIIGQQTETANALLGAAALSLAAQHDAIGPNAARFVLLDGVPEDEPLAGQLASQLALLPHASTIADFHKTPDAVADIHEIVTQREQDPAVRKGAIYLLINGLHWLRALRRKEDDFSFSMDRAEAQTPDTGAMLRTILLDGPASGVFTLCWCDTANSLSRWLDRSAQNEFASRVLLQMSANDSSLLIESTAAAKLGLHRAIFFDEERGIIEKFRPYSMPSCEFVNALADSMNMH